eukprot:gene41679-12618_t
MPRVWVDLKEELAAARAGQEKAERELQQVRAAAEEQGIKSSQNSQQVAKDRRVAKTDAGGQMLAMEKKFKEQKTALKKRMKEEYEQRVADAEKRAEDLEAKVKELQKKKKKEEKPARPVADADGWWRTVPRPPPRSEWMKLEPPPAMTEDTIGEVLRLNPELERKTRDD